METINNFNLSTQNNSEIFITSHAKRRMKERLGLNKSAARNLAAKAYCRGLNNDNTTGKANSYICHVNLNSPETNRFCRIYGENTFIFAKDKVDENIYLVTVFSTGNSMKKIMIKQENSMKGCYEYEK